MRTTVRLRGSRTAHWKRRCRGISGWGRGYRRRVGAVAEVLQQHVDAPVGHVVEQALVGGESAQEALRRVRNEVFLARVEINDPQLPGLDEGEIGSSGGKCGPDRDERCQQTQPGLS